MSASNPFSQFWPECRGRHKPSSGLLSAAAESPGWLARAILRGRGLVLDPAGAAPPGRDPRGPGLQGPGVPSSRGAPVIRSKFDKAFKALMHVCLFFISQRDCQLTINWHFTKLLLPNSLSNNSKTPIFTLKRPNWLRQCSLNGGDFKM